MLSTIVIHLVLGCVFFPRLAYVVNQGFRGRGRAPPFIASIAQRGGHRGGLREAGRPPLRGPGQRPRRNIFGPYMRLGRPTYGFVHGFRTWFLTRWFLVHGFGCDGFWSMVLDTMVFGPWYWMLQHV